MAPRPRGGSATICLSIVFRVFVLLRLLVFLVSTIAIDCLERLVSEMTYYVSSDGMLNVTHSPTHSSARFRHFPFHRRKETILLIFPSPTDSL